MKSVISPDYGFVDAHVHIEDARGLETVRAAGVWAVRDAGTRNGAGLVISRTGRSGEQPLVISAGWALSNEGGYGSHFGTPVGTRDEIQREISKLKKADAGIIKIMASGIVSLRRPGSITPGGFIAEEMQYIVDAAARQGLAVMAHANGEQAILDAVQAGARSIEHGFFMTEQALGVMAEQGTFWVPTVGALVRAADAEPIAKGMQASLAKLIQHQLAMMNRAHGMGVPLAVGTDCVLPDPGYKKIYDAELSYFEQAGISRTDVMTIACEGGAALLGIEASGK